MPASERQDGVEGVAAGILARVREALVAGDEAGHLAALEQLEAVVEPGSVAAGYAVLHRARRAFSAGDGAVARRRAEQAIELGRQNGNGRLERSGRLVLGDARHLSGDSGGAEEAFREVLQHDDPVDQRVALTGLSVIQRERGRLEAALASLDRGLAIEVDHPLSRANLLLRRGGVLVALGRGEAALEDFESARGLFASIGYARGLQQSNNQLGELARRRGELAVARAHYRLAVEGPTPEVVAVARLNLGLVCLGEGDWEAARQAFGFEAAGYLLPYARAGRLAAWAGLKRRRDFRLELRALAPVLAGDLCDDDVAWSLELAAEQAFSHGLLPGAARAAGGALGMWERLGRAREAARCRELLCDLADEGAPIPIGPFELVRPLGAGGMGEVWEGRHADQRVSVAVKVLHGEEARGVRGVRAFEAEIRAVAALRHPHVVYVFDHGLLDSTAEAMSGGRLVAGSPFLVMELGRGGSLVPWQGRLTWPGCRRILLDLLDALAHAHARGLIHRDLKPGNVLMHHPGNLGPGIRLTDFGLARALDSNTRTAIAGTPSYMSPEQLTGRWQHFGPWTDLYAFGCLAWTLVAGRPPFHGALDVVREAHVHKPPPPLVPRMEVPEGLEGWLRVLLAKDPRARFQHAADAARALEELGERPGRRQGVGPAPALAGPPTASETFLLDVAPAPEDEPTLEVPAPLPAAPPARVPSSWRRDRPAPLPPELLGAGLGLFGLRELPVAGRLEERDRIWEHLRSRETRVVVLRGPAGVGKSRLARWAQLRAAELGAALPLELAEDLGAIAGQLAGRRRGVVALLEDAHARPDRLELARKLLRSERSVPILALVTLRDRGGDAEVERALEALRAEPGAEVVELGPLDGTAMSELVGELLRLEPGLAATVVARAQGSPQFAVELVGDLVARDRIVPGPEGFRLPPGASLELPDGLHGVWQGRVEGVLSGLPPEAGLALELAAVLGRSVERLQLAQVCAEAGLLLPEALAGRLAEQGLAQETPTGWVFAQATLRESLVRRAQEADRLVRWHRACAAVVPESEPRRLGHHLAGAGDVEQAIPHLLEEARYPGRPGALQVLAEVERHLAGLGVPASDVRRGRMELYRSEALLERGRYLDALKLAEGLKDREGGEGWPFVRARAVTLMGRCCRALARYDEASRYLQEAVDRLRAIGEEAAAAHALHGLGLVDKIQGRHASAEQRIAEALEILERVDAAPASIGSAWMSRGSVALVAGHFEFSRACVTEALRIGRAHRVDILTATALAGLAEVDRLEGRLEHAEARYEEAWLMLREAGLGRSLVVRLNLGLVYQQRGQHERARTTLLEIQQGVRRQGRRGLDGVCAGLVLPSCVALGRLDEAREQLAHARDLLDQLGVAEPDVAVAAEKAAEDAEGALRRGCLGLARDQWELAGRAEDVARVAALLGADVDA